MLRLLGERPLQRSAKVSRGIRSYFDDRRWWLEDLLIEDAVCRAVEGDLTGQKLVAHNGERDPDYSEAATSTYMKGDEIRIIADIGIGRGKATVWTCDLTKEYVEINGDYRS